MDFVILWTDLAVADLEDTYSYLQKRNSAAAVRITRAIVKKVELLQTLPLMGKLFASRSGKEI